MGSVSKIGMIWIDMTAESGEFELPWDCNEVKILDIVWDNTTENQNPFIFFTNMSTEPWCIITPFFNTNYPEHTWHPPHLKYEHKFQKGQRIRYRIADISTAGLATATGLDGFLVILAEYISYL